VIVAGAGNLTSSERRGAGRVYLDGRQLAVGANFTVIAIRGCDRGAGASSSTSRRPRDVTSGLTHEPGDRLGAALLEAVAASLGSRGVLLGLGWPPRSRLRFQGNRSPVRSWRGQALQSKPLTPPGRRAYHRRYAGAGGRRWRHRACFIGIFGPLRYSIAIPDGRRGDRWKPRALADRKGGSKSHRPRHRAAGARARSIQGAAGDARWHPKRLPGRPPRGSWPAPPAVHLIVVDEVATGSAAPGGTMFGGVNRERGVSSGLSSALREGQSRVAYPCRWAATFTRGRLRAAFLGKAEEGSSSSHGHTLHRQPLGPGPWGSRRPWLLPRNRRWRMPAPRFRKHGGVLWAGFAQCTGRSRIPPGGGSWPEFQIGRETAISGEPEICNPGPTCARRDSSGRWANVSSYGWPPLDAQAGADLALLRRRATTGRRSGETLDERLLLITGPDTNVGNKDLNVDLAGPLARRQKLAHGAPRSSRQVRSRRGCGAGPRTAPSVGEIRELGRHAAGKLGQQRPASRGFYRFPVCGLALLVAPRPRPCDHRPLAGSSSDPFAEPRENQGDLGTLVGGARWVGGFPDHPRRRTLRHHGSRNSDLAV